MRIAVWWEQELWGGVDTHLLTLLLNWPDKSDQFIIFHNSGNQGVKRILASLSKLEQVTMVPFPDSSSFLPAPFAKVARYFSLPLRFLLMKRRAQRLLRFHGPFDVLFGNNGGYPGAWGTLAALWAGSSLGLRTRLLLVHHEAMGRGPLRHSFESLLDLGVQHWATDLVAVSRATRSTLIERRSFYNYLNPIRVIHNGVDMSTDADTLTVDLRAQLAIPADSFVVGMVGRLERYKGHEDLILALGELPSNTISKVVVVFVGGGSLAERERLQSVAQKTGAASQVRFAGYIDGSIGTLMCQFDLLAMLTKDFEGFGLTIAEAMWAGTPVLATMVGAVPEFVTEDVAILVQPEAPDEIADALLRVINNGEEARQRAIRARQHISKYNGQAMAKKFHRLLLVSGE
jgi:glycosyltransferase involved in cell wall biosynthesis